MGVVSPAVAEVASLADIADVASLAGIAKVASLDDVTEVVSLADFAEVASLADIAEVGSSAKFSGCATIGVTSSVDTVNVVTTGVAFQEKCDVPSGLVCDYYDYFYENPDYFDLMIQVIFIVTPMCMASLNQ